MHSTWGHQSQERAKEIQGPFALAQCKGVGAANGWNIHCQLGRKKEKKKRKAQMEDPLHYGHPTFCYVPLLWNNRTC